MAEKAVETYLYNRIEALGGRSAKWVSPGWAGVPDRIVFLPGGKIFFVELKDAGKKLRKLQAYRAKQIREWGQVVYGPIDSKADVDRMLREVLR